MGKPANPRRLEPSSPNPETLSILSLSFRNRLHEWKICMKHFYMHTDIHAYTAYYGEWGFLLSYTLGGADPISSRELVHACLQWSVHPSIHPSIHPCIHPPTHPLTQPATQPASHPSIPPGMHRSMWYRRLRKDVASFSESVCLVNSATVPQQQLQDGVGRCGTLL